MSLKKIITILSVLILGLCLSVATALFLLYKNQERLTQHIIQDINEMYVGHMKVSKSNISAFANFPYISVTLEDVRFYANEKQRLKPILKAEEIYVGFDVIDVFKGNYTLKSIKISRGFLDIIQYADGSININKAISSSNESLKDAQSSNNLDLNLQEVTFENFQIKKIDITSNRVFDIDISRTLASFERRDRNIMINMNATAIVNIFDESTKYFTDRHLEIQSALRFDEREQLLYFDKGYMNIEKAAFHLSGSIDLDDDFNLDLHVKGDKPNFDLLTAFAPIEIVEQLEKYSNEGNIYFEGNISGQVSELQSPLLEFSFGCKNAFFINKTYNRKVEDLQFTGFFTNGEKRSIESMELRLENFYAKPEQGIFRGNLFVRNFLDPYIAVNLNSDLDLTFLGEFFGLEGLRRIKGQVLLDMNFNELLDLDLPQQSMEKLKEGVQSELIMKNLSFTFPDFPHTIDNLNAHASMRNGKVQLDKLEFSIGDSRISMNGSLSDFPALFHRHDKKVSVTLNASSPIIDFDFLLSKPNQESPFKEAISDFSMKLAFESSVNELTDFRYLPKGEFFIHDFNARFQKYPHALHDFKADLLITDNDFRLINFSGEIDKSDFHFSGGLSNYGIWFKKDKQGKAVFDFQLDSKVLKIKDLLSYDGENYLPEEYQDEELDDVLLKGQLDIHYQGQFQSAILDLHHLSGHMKLHPLKLRDFKGQIIYDKEKLQFNQLHGKMGKSDFNVSLELYNKEQLALGAQQKVFVRSNVFDLSELSDYNPKAGNNQKSHNEAWNIFEIPFSNTIVKADFGLLNYHSILLNNLKIRGHMTEDHYIYIDTLNVEAAGGNIDINGYFNGSDKDSIYFKSEINAHQIAIEQLMLKFDNFGQDYLLSDNLEGILSGKIISTLHMHPDLVTILEDSEAVIDIQMKNGIIKDFGPLNLLTSYFKDKNLNRVRFDTLANTIELKGGTLFIPKMNISSTLGFIEISGKQDMDNTYDMEYIVSIPWNLVAQAGISNAWQTLRAEFEKSTGGKEDNADKDDEIQYREDQKKVRFIHMRISGNSENYKAGLVRTAKNK